MHKPDRSNGAGDQADTGRAGGDTNRDYLGFWQPFNLRITGLIRRHHPQPRQLLNYD
jgi:hypothetical protein